ncbi:hypothetical protein OAB00_00385 [Akkermansiaceae bacterium]|nr:hypothetical protein [Akkermansiaceae bacterium]
MQCICCNEHEMVEVAPGGPLHCGVCKICWFKQCQFLQIEKYRESLLELAVNGAELEQVPSVAESCANTKCCDTPLHSRKYARAPHVTIVECYSCGGVGVNVYQLFEILENAMSDKQFEAYQTQLANSVEGFVEMTHKIETGSLSSRYVKAWQKMRFWDKDK